MREQSTTAPQHTPTPWKADIRTGAFAIYPATDEHTCFSELANVAVVYQSGRGEPFAPGHYLTITDEQAANAEFIVRAINSHAALVEALEPFANFFEKFSAKPMVGIGNEFYGIHTGTEWAASLRISDMKRAAEALAAAKGTR